MKVKIFIALKKGGSELIYARNREMAEVIAKSRGLRLVGNEQ